jgi:hypothetical protein
MTKKLNRRQVRRLVESAMNEAPKMGQRRDKLIDRLEEIYAEDYESIWEDAKCISPRSRLSR